MRIQLVIPVALVCALLAVAPASAQVMNGSFEEGFNGYTMIGDVRIVSADFGVMPTDGQSQALLTNGIGAVPIADLEAFLGVAPGTVSQITTASPTQGSALSMLIQAPPGVMLQLDVDFLTNELSSNIFNDTAFFMVMDDVPILLANTNSGLMTSPTIFARETGYFSRVVTLEMPESGVQLLSFGVVDLTDTVIDTGLLVDNIQLLNRDPDCSAAVADPLVIRRQDGRMLPVDILGVIDPDGDALTFSASSILQNEPVRFRGTGILAPDATLDPIQVRAGRDLGASGRVYLIDFTADDGRGGACTGSVRVCVPRNPFLPICDGPLYDSTEKPSVRDLIDSILGEDAPDEEPGDAPAMDTDPTEDEGSETIAPDVAANEDPVDVSL